jgi:hypothetical protein
MGGVTYKDVKFWTDNWIYFTLGILDCNLQSRYISYTRQFIIHAPSLLSLLSLTSSLVPNSNGRRSLSCVLELSPRLSHSNS